MLPIALGPTDPCPPLAVIQQRWLEAKEAAGTPMHGAQLSRLDHGPLVLGSRMLVCAPGIPGQHASKIDLQRMARRNQLAKLFARRFGDRPDGAA